MMTMQLWITLFLVLWIYVLWSRRRIYRLMLQLPGPIGYPLLGALPRFWGHKSGLRVVDDDMKRWGSTYLSWFGPIPVLAVGDPKVAQDILSSPHSIRKSNIGVEIMAEILGHGIAIVNEPQWSIHRKALNPAFGQHIVVGFMNIFNAETGVLLSELDKLVGKGEMSLMTLLKNFTLRLSTQTTMGSDVKNEKIYKNGSMMKTFQSLFQITTDLILAPWLNNRLMRRFYGYDKVLGTELSMIRSLIKKMVYRKLDGNVKKTDRNKLESKNQVFIDLAIEQFHSRVLSYEDIENAANTIIMASFESTAVVMACTLLQLAMYPEYQEKLYEKLKAVFSNDGNFDVSYDDIQKLTYLDMVINESMRLMPVFPFIARQLTADTQLSNGVVLPKDLNIGISIYHIHRNKAVWGPQADIFNPDNCLPQNLLDLHPYAFIPFFKGKRNCIGWRYAMLTLKVALAKILRNYKFSTKMRQEDLIIVNNFFLKFKEEPCLELHRRN